MIVETMTLEEIHKEIQEDFWTLEKVAYYRADLFKSVVLKTKKYPVRRRYQCFSKNHKNRYFLQFTASKISAWDNPDITIYTIFSRPEGLYCAIVATEEGGMTYIYPPHFFSRYRERIIRDDSLSAEDLIHLYMSRYWGFYAEYVDPDNSEVKDWEQLVEEGTVDFVGTSIDGVLFGQRYQKVALVKTIVSESMLYPDQVDFYERVYLTHWANLREHYPEKVYDYLMDLEEDYYQPPAEATAEAIEQLRQKYNAQ